MQTKTIHLRTDRSQETPAHLFIFYTAIPMKTHIFRTIRILALAAFIAYVVWLYIMQAQLVWPMFSAYNIAAFVGLWLVLVFLLVAAFVPTLLPDNRRSVALFGIALILCAHYYLIDTPALHIYTSDLLKILGLCLVIA